MHHRSCLTTTMALATMAPAMAGRSLKGRSSWPASQFLSFFCSFDRFIDPITVAPSSTALLNALRKKTFFGEVQRCLTAVEERARKLEDQDRVRLNKSKSIPYTLPKGARRKGRRGREVSWLVGFRTASFLVTLHHGFLASRRPASRGTRGFVPCKGVTERNFVFGVANSCLD